MTVEISLEGKVAVITGGAAGIGSGISRLLAEAGANLVINDISKDYLEEIVTDIEKQNAKKSGGAKVASVLGDIREPETLDRLKQTALDFSKQSVGKEQVDILINNVGDYRPSGRFVETDEEQWMAQFEITLKHVFSCTRAFLPMMVEAQSGAIVNNATVEAFRACPNNSAYTAFNAGIVAFTKTLAIEHGKDNIRVNAIAPDMANTLQTPADAMLRGRDPELIKSWVPLGRFGEPIDYGRVVLFLVSDLAGFMTGQTLMVDGGTMASSGWYGRYQKEGWTNLPDLN